MAYLSLSTANLPDPVIDPAAGEEATEYFGTLLWSGDDNATRTIQSGGSGVTGDINFTPDFAWVKRRNGASNGSDHMLLDVVRGVGSFNALSCNGSQAEGLTEAGSSWVNFGDINAFTTDGFTVQKGSDSSHTLEGINQSGGTYVGWSWKAGGTAVSNIDGSITSTVSANTTSGFSVVSYTGNGNQDATIGHGLSTTPDMIIFKNTSITKSWRVWHSGLSGSTYYMNLDAAFAESSSSTVVNGQSSTTFTVGTDTSTNGSGNDHIAYCFHSIEGFSKCGSYVGNGSTDGPFVYTGFRPAFVMVKRSDTTGTWQIWDTKRDAYNFMDRWLTADGSGVEGDGSAAGGYIIDSLSNGFKLREDNAYTNASGGTYIYACFSENPFKYSNAR